MGIEKVSVVSEDVQARSIEKKDFSEEMAVEVNTGKEINEGVSKHINSELKKVHQSQKEEHDKIDQAIEDMNETVSALHKELRFKLHEEAERMMVEVVNTENNEVLKEIPPKEMLDMMGRIKEVVGLLLDEKI